MIPQLFQWRSLKTRVTVLTLVIFVISLWILELFASRILREDMKHQLGEQQQSAVSFVAEQVNDELAERFAALKLIASQIDAPLMGNRPALQALLEQRPILDLLFNGGVFVTGPDGVSLASVPLAPEGLPRIGVNYMDRDFVITALREGKPVIGKPVLGRVLKSPIVAMAVPILDAQGKVVGTLVGVINLGKPSFLDKITQHRYGITGGYVLIAAQHRLVVIATDKTRIMESLPAVGVNAWVDKFAQGYEGSAVAVNPKGVEVLVSGKGVPAAGWYMLASLPTADAFAPINAMQQRMMNVTLLLTLLAGSLTWWILRRQLAPMLDASKALASREHDEQQTMQPLPIARQDEIGELIGGFNRLLADLGQREESLKESEFRWKFAIEGSGDGVWDWNIQTDEVRYSRRWKEMLGYSEADILPSNLEWVTRIHPDDQSYVAAAMQTYLEGKTEIYVVEYRLRCKDETYKWILGRGTVVSRNEDGKPLRMIGTHTDITQRKKVEAELLQHRNHLEELVAARTSELEQSRDAAEAGNRAKTIFLANMSHELRTPMNGVIGMIDLVLRRATDPKQIDWLNKSKGAAQRMVSVVNDILDFSKIEAERLPLEEKEFSLSQMIDDVIAMLDLTAEAKGLTLIREMPATFPDQLSGDAFHLRQILQNLLGNACKFSDQGTITVRASAAAQDGESILVRIEVEDQGIGISPEQQGALFQAFTQADGSMTRKYGGSGLGLVISKRLANMMGGDVGVVSQEGRGSTFWATVRLKSAKTSEVGI
jgi:PAS domain S-box-containing protein